MLYFSRGSTTDELCGNDLKEGLYTALDKLDSRSKVLAIPPDFTRYHSQAGELTRYAYQYYRDRLADILPALGTHFAMSAKEINAMFGDIPVERFKVHNWKEDLITLGRVPQEFVEAVSENRVHYDWPAQVNKLLIQGGFDLVLSIGQVVPHEVVGMANYNKNIFCGNRRPGRHQPQPLSWRRLRHGADDGPHRYAGAASAKLCLRAFRSGTAHRLCFDSRRTEARWKFGSEGFVYR